MASHFNVKSKLPLKARWHLVPTPYLILPTAPHPLACLLHPQWPPRSLNIPSMPFPQVSARLTLSLSLGLCANSSVRPSLTTLYKTVPYPSPYSIDHLTTYFIAYIVYLFIFWVTYLECELLEASSLPNVGLVFCNKYLLNQRTCSCLCAKYLICSYHLTFTTTVWSSYQTQVISTIRVPSKMVMS